MNPTGAPCGSCGQFLRTRDRKEEASETFIRGHTSVAPQLIHDCAGHHAGTCPDSSHVWSRWDVLTAVYALLQHRYPSIRFLGASMHHALAQQAGTSLASLIQISAGPNPITHHIPDTKANQRDTAIGTLSVFPSASSPRNMSPTIQAGSVARRTGGNHFVHHICIKGYSPDPTSGHCSNPLSYSGSEDDTGNC